jgi:hypothetical protein
MGKHTLEQSPEELAYADARYMWHGWLEKRRPYVIESFKEMVANTIAAEYGWDVGFARITSGLALDSVIDEVNTANGGSNNG